MPFHDLPEGQTHYQNDGCGIAEHNMIPDLLEVKLAEDGTPLAQFQKDRTDAISEMFNRDGLCGKLHSTSRFFALLDASVERLLLRDRAAFLEKVMPDEEKFMQGERLSEFLEGYNAALSEIRNRAKKLV